MVHTTVFIPKDTLLMLSNRAKCGQQKLLKKGCGRLIHVSTFIKEENGCLIIRNEEGDVVKDAQCIIYLGMGADAWWDHTQLLMQVDKAIEIFDEAHPDCVALFVFNQSSAHASLRHNVLCAFEMNKSNGGGQRQQKDTIILINNLCPKFHSKAQKMTTENGKAKGLQQTLEERGFNVWGMWAKCRPVCPFESESCSMAQLLSKQDNFRFQDSLLKHKVKAKGHICMFLPKFHCELNPIKMVCV
jgi:hypothetical protein